jgi:hypothetical protein
VATFLKVTKGSKETHNLKTGMSSSWLYLAFGITATLTILGAFAIIIAQGELASGERTATVTGKVVCLPHKKPWFGLFGGPETLECFTGFSGEDGRYYGLNFQDSESVELLAETEGSGKTFIISGEITIPPEASSADYDRYDVAGVIDVNFASIAER